MSHTFEGSTAARTASLSAGARSDRALTAAARRARAALADSTGALRSTGGPEPALA